MRTEAGEDNITFPFLWWHFDCRVGNVKYLNYLSVADVRALCVSGTILSRWGVCVVGVCFAIYLCGGSSDPNAAKFPLSAALIPRLLLARVKRSLFPVEGTRVLSPKSKHNICRCAGAKKNMRNIT